MSRHRDARRHKRTVVDAALSLFYQDQRGEAKSLHARTVDISDSGIRLESTDPIEVGSHVNVRIEEFGLIRVAVVRHCTRHGSKYVIGLELTTDRDERSEEFVDYYEILQISPHAEVETIHRVYRMLAARYHPDNQETGDTEQFLLLGRAYETLSNHERRATYDARHEARRVEPIPVFELKEFVGGVEGEENRRLGMLCLLYNRRRMNPDNPGFSLLEFERMMSFPREHLMFTIWFLKEKQYIRSEQDSSFAITAHGADYVEVHLPSHRVMYKLIKGGVSEEGKREDSLRRPSHVEGD